MPKPTCWPTCRSNPRFRPRSGWNGCGGFPAQHRAKIPSTYPIERLNGEIKRRSDVVGIFPNEAAVTRLIGAILLEQNDEWAVQRAHYMTLETIAPLGNDLTVSLPAMTA